jgi:hypothetical protein
VVSTALVPVPKKNRPLDGAVHENHRLRVAATPPCAGSSVSRVARAVEMPVTDPVVPVMGLGAEKASWAGGTPSAAIAPATLIRFFVSPLRLSSTDCPLERSAASTSLTAAPGTACFIRAHAPATCGAAIEVPCLLAYWLPVIDDRITEPGASSESCEEEFENDETRSSVVFVEPTLIADEVQAGDEMAFDEPLLPEAMTVAMPTARRSSMIVFSGLPLSHAAP